VAYKFRKSGETVALTIPKEIAERYHVAPGVEVEIVPTDEGIFLQPIGVGPWFSIEWERAMDAVLEQYRAAFEAMGD